MSVQRRRRGVSLKVWKQVEVTDKRGNRVKVPDSTSPHEVRGWVIPGRSSRAEVAGQVGIDVITVGVSVLPDVGLWSRVEYDGREWDLVSPPAYHHGSRSTRHYTLTLRARSGGTHHG